MAGRPARKLAVILHADVAGSTALVHRDETLAHERIQDAFHRLAKINDGFGGITHEQRGDALLAEFPRASDAVTAAIAFQEQNAEINAGLGDDVRPEVRIGVALGEVVIADHTITGAGVVLAQRLEQLATPGGVCIQDAAFQTLPGRLPFSYDPLPEQAVKGFPEPVRAYTATLAPGATVPSPEDVGKPMGSSMHRPRALAATAISLAVVGIGLAVWLPWRPAATPAPADGSEFSLPEKPSIAVLPFTNMSDDTAQEYFVDGMTDDLITDLSKLSGLFVIARNSSFAYKGRAVNVGQVAKELGVRYVLEGSVRRAGERVRINAQLIDAETDGHLWAERYDGLVSDVFDLQDRVTQKIVNALAIRLSDDEEARTKRAETSVPEAYDAFLEGWARYRHFTGEDFRKAIAHFERAIELDPGYSRAHAALAAIYTESRWHSWRVVDNFYRHSNRLAREHLHKAMQHPTAIAYRVSSFIHTIDGYYGKAIEHAKRAIALDPNDPSGYEAVARASIYVGDPEETLEYIARAERLDPRSSYSYLRGVALFHLERYPEAVDEFLEFVKGRSDSKLPYLYLASAYGYLDRKSDAKSAFETFRRVSHEQGIYIGSNALDQVAIYYFKSGSPEDERLREGLRKAGFDAPPEILESSPDGIRLRKTDYGRVATVYAAAEEHCQAHGRKSFLISAATFPEYAFQCR